MSANKKKQELVCYHTQSQSALCRLPVELRLAILELVLGPTKTRSLYVTRHIWSWKGRDSKRKFLDILLVCRSMHDEAIDLLYSRHELCLYTDRTWDVQAQSLVRYCICGIEDYTAVFQRVQRLRLTLFVTGDAKQDDVLVALLRWLMAVLKDRPRPLKLLTLEFCAMKWKFEYKPTAILYAAQKFRSLGPTKFNFQCGFSAHSGSGSEDAMEALMQHANEKLKKPSREVTSDEALRKLSKAWVPPIQALTAQIKATTDFSAAAMRKVGLKDIGLGC